MPVADQGANLDRYMLIPRTLIFLTRGDQVLLLKGAQNKRLWSGLYNGIGGHIERGEDALSAAHRELFEETGLRVPNLALCGIATIDTQMNPGVCIFIFTGEYQGGEPIRSTEGSLEWIKIQEIKKIPIVADLPLLLPKILAYKIDSPIFFSRSFYDDNGNIRVKFG